VDEPLTNNGVAAPSTGSNIMTKEKAELLGWKFSHLDTTVEKGREIYMMPSKAMALKMVEKREQK
jgi:hypothetical protein